MILLGLGANLPSSAGTPFATLRAALDKLSSFQIVPVATSQFYVTPSWPDPREPAFVNAVVRVESSLSPARMLERLHEIEGAFGRRRSTRNAPRTLDIDILDYEGRIESGPPILPHPRMEHRAFVLVPLGEIAPTWRHPVSGLTIRQLIDALPLDQQNPAVLE